jgi:hypothetical protein
LALATPQLSYVRAFSLAKPKLRGWQPVPATSRLSYVRGSSPVKLKLQGYWPVLATSQLSSYEPFSRVKPMFRGLHRAADRGFAPQPEKRPQK